MADRLEAIVFEGQGEFSAVSDQEFMLVERYMRDHGMLHEEVERDTASEAAGSVIDESKTIVNLCASVKELTGNDIARGFKDSVHVLKFLNYDDCGLPEAVPDDNDGSAPVLIAA